MKTTLLAAALALTSAGAAQAAEPRKLVTLLTAPEAQTQLMAMVLTMNAVAHGAEAKILLCGPAGDIALKAAPEPATAGQPPQGASPQGLLKTMIEKNGVQVQVCAIYLPGLCAGAEVVIVGVTAVTPDAMDMELRSDDSTVFRF